MNACFLSLMANHRFQNLMQSKELWDFERGHGWRITKAVSPFFHNLTCLIAIDKNKIKNYHFLSYEKLIMTK